MARPKAGFDAYKDVRPLWQAAVSYGACKHIAPNNKHAKEIIQRLHAFRVADRKQSIDGFSVFDDFIVTNPEPNLIVINKRAIVGLTTTLDGEPIDMEYIKRAIADMDPRVEQTIKQYGIDDEAERLRRKYKQQPTINELEQERAEHERQANKLQIDPDKPLFDD